MPIVHPTSFIHSTATVCGNVTLGARVSVWAGAVIRGDSDLIEIGEDSNIQDGTVVHVMRGSHPTSIGSDVTIGHGAIVHGCALADRILIGMGAILLNGVDVGEDSIVAAGTLVTEESKIPPRSLVMGSPGKVKRQLSDAEVASILEYSKRYVEYRLDYVHA